MVSGANSRKKQHPASWPFLKNRLLEGGLLPCEPPNCWWFRKGQCHLVRFGESRGTSRLRSRPLPGCSPRKGNHAGPLLRGPQLPAAPGRLLGLLGGPAVRPRGADRRVWPRLPKQPADSPRAPASPLPRGPRLQPPPGRPPGLSGIPPTPSFAPSSQLQALGSQRRVVGTRGSLWAGLCWTPAVFI